MCNFLESKSIYTSVHSHGVATMGEALSKLMGFKPEELKAILIASYLHYEGKFDIQIELLENNRRLKEKEFLLIISHFFIPTRFFRR